MKYSGFQKLLQDPARPLNFMMWNVSVIELLILKIDVAKYSH